MYFESSKDQLSADFAADVLFEIIEQGLPRHLKTVAVIIELKVIGDEAADESQVTPVVCVKEGGVQRLNFPEQAGLVAIARRFICMHPARGTRKNRHSTKK
jgi:hypothetical protein